jgi:hypothetical protein
VAKKGLVLKNERDGLAEVREALFPRFALTVRAGNFRAIGDVPQAVSLDDRGELVVHKSIFAPQERTRSR